MRAGALIAAGIAAPFVLFGCTSVVAGPPDPVDPTTVFVLRESLHIGVVVPDGNRPPKGYIEYGYGDWGYYALGQNSWYETIGTVLWSTPGALSRRVFEADGPERLRQVAHWTELDELRVGSAPVGRLRERLEARFTKQQNEAVRQPRERMTFIPAGDGYWFGNTCADVAADWLRELGCTVTFVPIRGNLMVER